MRNYIAFSFLLLVGIISLSASSKSDKLIGKWEAYKMVKNGKTRDASKERNVPWLEFSEENVLWVGEGTKDKKRGEWMLDEDNKTIYTTLKRKELTLIIERLTKKKLVVRMEERNRKMKIFLKRIS